MRLADYNNGVQSATSAATLACNTVELFSDATGNKNMLAASSGCLRAIDKLNTEEFQVVISAAECVYVYCGKKSAMRDCLKGVNWYPVAKKIAGGF